MWKSRSNMFLLLLLLVCLSAQPLLASSSGDQLTSLIASLKIDIQLLKNQIENYEKQIQSLSIIIDDLQKSNSEMQTLSQKDKVLLANSKAELEKVTAQLIESKAALERLNDLLASYSLKLSNRKYWIGGAFIVGAVGGFFLGTAID